MLSTFVEEFRYEIILWGLYLKVQALCGLREREFLKVLDVHRI